MECGPLTQAVLHAHVSIHYGVCILIITSLILGFISSLWYWGEPGYITGVGIVKSYFGMYFELRECKSN